jgi:ABC-type hemin transport system ATPase subunit
MEGGALLADGSPEEVLTKSLLERLFRTPVLVGQTGPTNAPYIYPLRNNLL